MTLDALIMLVGALIAYLASPVSGFPSSWDNSLIFVLGIVVIALGIVVRRRNSHQAQPKKTFVENAPTTNIAAESQEKGLQGIQ